MLGFQLEASKRKTWQWLIHSEGQLRGVRSTQATYQVYKCIIHLKSSRCLGGFTSSAPLLNMMTHIHGTQCRQARYRFTFRAFLSWPQRRKWKLSILSDAHLNFFRIPYQDRNHWFHALDIWMPQATPADSYCHCGEVQENQEGNRHQLIHAHQTRDAQTSLNSTQAG